MCLCHSHLHDFSNFSFLTCCAAQFSNFSKAATVSVVKQCALSGVEPAEKLFLIGSLFQFQTGEQEQVSILSTSFLWLQNDQTASFNLLASQNRNLVLQCHGELLPAKETGSIAGLVVWWFGLQRSARTQCCEFVGIRIEPKHFLANCMPLSKLLSNFLFLHFFLHFFAEFCSLSLGRVDPAPHTRHLQGLFAPSTQNSLRSLSKVDSVAHRQYYCGGSEVPTCSPQKRYPVDSSTTPKEGLQS